MIALLMEMGVDFVARLHQARQADFRRGQSLGPGDRLVTWIRPQRPEWMIAQSARRHGVSPRRVSFTAALQKVAAVWCLLPGSDDEWAARIVAAQMLQQAAGGRNCGAVTPIET